MTMGLIDEYLKLVIEYKTKFGQDALVLLQCGSFAECYSINSASPEDDVTRVSECLGILATRKNKAIEEISRSNHALAGFPMVKLNDNLQILVKAGYTCVVVEQEAEDPTSRKVTGVFSAGTLLDSKAGFESNNLMCVIVEQNKHYISRRDVFTVGLSVIDVSTGKCSVYECLTASDTKYALEETVRFVRRFNPSEVLLVDSQQLMSKEELQSVLELNGRVIRVLEPRPETMKISYAQSFLADIYPQRGVLTPIDFIGLERQHLAWVSLVQLLKFACEHDSGVVRKIEKPQVLSDVKHMTLANTAVTQLGVANNKEETGSLSNLLTPLCSTAFGKRQLKERLSMPLADADMIEIRYRQVDALLIRHESRYMYERVEDHLKGIIDIERLHRKAIQGRLQPLEFVSLVSSYEQIQKLFDCITPCDSVVSDLLPDAATREKFIEIRQRNFAAVNLSALARCNLNSLSTSIFNPNYFTHIDALQKDLQSAELFLKGFANVLNAAFPRLNDGGVAQFVSLSYTERDGHSLTLTKKRAEWLKEKLGDMGVVDVGGKQIGVKEIHFNNSLSCCKVTCSHMQGQSEWWSLLVARLKTACIEEFIKLTQNFVLDNHDLLLDIVKSAADIDVAKCAAKSAHNFRYCRPRVQESSRGSIRAQLVRHALIERLPSHTQYVANDVTLTGPDCDDPWQGSFIYGVNSSGKSSYMKAIGLSIVLAQAGFFVPAETFEYTPYDCVMTRIITVDDITKGLSSFGVEMEELRGILNRANSRSLILGDEIASTTESASGLAIVAASVIDLVKHKANFVFATHLHALGKLPHISELPQIKHQHMQVTYVAETSLLTYCRKLQPGPGSAIYGLEVCKAMGLPQNVLDNAHAIRRDILENVDQPQTEAHQSRYNKALYVKNCEVCGSKGEHTHHIKFQCSADADGFIGAIHKNNLSNLVVLCEPCHDMVHTSTGTKKLVIHGYCQTSEGLRLSFEHTDIKQKPAKSQKGRKPPTNK